MDHIVEYSDYMSKNIMLMASLAQPILHLPT